VSRAKLALDAGGDPDRSNSPNHKEGPPPSSGRCWTSVEYSEIRTESSQRRTIGAFAPLLLRRGPAVFRQEKYFRSAGEVNPSFWRPPHDLGRPSNYRFFTRGRATAPETGSADSRASRSAAPSSSVRDGTLFVFGGLRMAACPEPREPAALESARTSSSRYWGAGSGRMSELLLRLARIARATRSARRSSRSIWHGRIVRRGDGRPQGSVAIEVGGARARVRVGTPSSTIASPRGQRRLIAWIPEESSPSAPVAAREMRHGVHPARAAAPSVRVTKLGPVVVVGRRTSRRTGVGSQVRAPWSGVRWPTRPSEPRSDVRDAFPFQEAEHPRAPSAEALCLVRNFFVDTARNSWVCTTAAGTIKPRFPSRFAAR